MPDKRSDYPTESAWRTRPENIQRIMAERGVDERRARAIARGHDRTPEHGRVSTKEQVSTHTIYETNSNYQAGLILDRAARESERRAENGKSQLRVSITAELRDGSRHSLYANPTKSGKPGMTATYLAELRGQQGGSVKSFVAGSPIFDESEEEVVNDDELEEVFDYDVATVIGDEGDIALMEITVYDFE